MDLQALPWLCTHYVYVGTEGWCIGAELRPGSQHSQNDFTPFLNTVLQRLRRVTSAPVLLRLDNGHDAEDTRREVENHRNVDHIIKLNPRKQYTVTAWLPTFEPKFSSWMRIFWEISAFSARRVMQPMAVALGKWRNAAEDAEVFQKTAERSGSSPKR